MVGYEPARIDLGPGFPDTDTQRLSAARSKRDRAYRDLLALPPRAPIGEYRKLVQAFRQAFDHFEAIRINEMATGAIRPIDTEEWVLNMARFNCQRKPHSAKPIVYGDEVFVPRYHQEWDWLAPRDDNQGAKDSAKTTQDTPLVRTLRWLRMTADEKRVWQQLNALHEDDRDDATVYDDQEHPYTVLYVDWYDFDGHLLLTQHKTWQKKGQVIWPSLGRSLSVAA